MSEKTIRFSVRERILIYLRTIPEWNGFVYDGAAPEQRTQDGVATALGLSRAHAALELKALVDQGHVQCELSHVKGNASKRKCYFLTNRGMCKSEIIENVALCVGYSTGAVIAQSPAKKATRDELRDEVARWIQKGKDLERRLML